MDEGGGRIEVGIASARAGLVALAERPGAGHHVNLWVLDDGAGMDDATRLRAFDPFFTTKPSGAGTGLGLAVVHGIVQAHDGAITLDSTPGVGTRFDLYFAEVDAAVAGNGGDAVPEGAAVVGRGERIIYIDDDEVMPLMVDRLLQRAGYRVRCFGAPLAALAAVRSHPDEVDVVVTDFNMPGLSGLAVAAELAQLRPDLPVLLISGLVSDELRSRAAQCGVREVLEKQFALEALAPAVHRALTRPASASRAA
jgi:CheY-like chemotaxis protein